MEGSSTGTSLLTQSLQRLEEEDQAQEDRLCSSFQKLQVGFQNEEADADNKYENGIEEQEKQLIVQSSSANLVTPQNPIPHKVGPADFELLRLVGGGAFGKVFQVRGRFNNEIYAMKVMSSGQTLGVKAQRFRGHTSPHRNVKEKKLCRREIKSPFCPKVIASPMDISRFDKIWTEQSVKKTLSSEGGSPCSPQTNELFRGYSFVADELFQDWDKPIV
eukprot:TRINITY_DN2956_c0_g1_i7.p1 TRINITY_DN2956_c0_g1~~TRINITY_DN2956_c0_g1_i7.p1  ORF type:complete len:218 (-),score=42.53 TRINITY_DN2956_c0_g1_i7:42-695(-)